MASEAVYAKAIDVAEKMLGYQPYESTLRVIHAAVDAVLTVTPEQRQALADRLDEYMETKYGFVLGTEDRDVYLDSLLHILEGN